ncbi:MAG: cell division protein FtsL [Erysipelothrix sp.]|nr:cell division protein FtsL [Erysipelothrix sp.]
MAKIVRKRTVRRINWAGMVQLLFVLSFTISFISTIFVRSNNAKLAREIEKTQYTIVQMEQKNESILREVNALGDYANIVEKAEEAGLHHFTENSVFVKLGD